MATIVFDADGVLWDGIILYGDEVTLRPGIREVLKELHKRHHRIICCSKNDLLQLCKVLKKHGLFEYFEPGGIYASFDIPKSEMFRDFIGDNECLFIDDDPFQRAEVQFAYPHVEAEFFPDPLDILNHVFVSRAETAEDLRRVTLLREQRAREQAEKGYSKGFQLFLHESKLVLTIYDPPPPEQQSRVLDLLNRTNELKTTGKRYPHLPDAPGCRLISASLVDTFGDYGVIGVGVLGEGDATVMLSDLAVSCRTQGRGVGTAMVVYLCQREEQGRQRSVLGKLEKTDQNWRMQALFEYLGFEKDLSFWRWTPGISKTISYPAWLEVRVQQTDHIEE